MKVSNERVIEVFSELKIKVKDQNVEIKHLKEKFEIDYEDKVQ